MMAESELLDVGHLPTRVREQGSPRLGDDGLSSLEQMELSHTQHVLHRVGGNKVRAAEILGISRTQLYRIMRAGGREVLMSSAASEPAEISPGTNLKNQEDS
jgi:transcriptional regulator with PAS, ATPase and Fis domain